MAFNHGVRVLEEATDIVAPITGTSGLQVVFGTAPVNMAADPYSVTNTPVLANSYAEAVSKLGYSEEKDAKGHFLYTLCESMYASFKLFNVAPVVFVNVLDPAKHKKTLEEQTLAVTKLEAVLTDKGVLLDTVKVTKEEGEALAKDTDYLLSFDTDGSLLITLVAGGAGESEANIKVTADVIDPSKVEKSDIIGISNGNTETGLEVLRQIYPKFGMTPGLIVAPGWGHMAEIAAVIAGKCEEINGRFSCEAVIDIDSKSDGNAATYDAVKEGKEAIGLVSPHVMAVWPCVVSGSYKFWYSAVFAALTAYTDANNDDVPHLSPSNKLISINGAVLSDAVYTLDEDGESGTWDKEINLDQSQANIVNSYGVATAINENGWKTWGNRTVCYPAVSDPKDMFFCCRRMFSWYGNSFILTYTQKVDNPMSRRFIESIIDAEKIRLNAYVAQGKLAAGRVEWLESDNPETDIINGKVTFRTHLSPYTPAEDILNILQFDTKALRDALIG